MFKIKNTKLLAAIISLTSFCFVLQVRGATGDILGTSLITNNPGNYGTRTIVTEGCISGECVMMDCATGICTGNDAWGLDIIDSREVTVEWYERYNIWPMTWTLGGNKSIRPFWGPGSSDYMHGLISFYGGNEMYTSALDTGIVTPGENVEIWTTPPHSDSCADLGNGTYDCDVPNHVKLTWEGMGTNWRKMKMYIKLPSSNSATDGENKLWIDDELIYSIIDVSRSTLGSDPKVTRFTFAPVDECQEAHEHWYDEITVYEGYVPPGGADTVAPANPSGLSVI